jgi:hypothetical protein
MLIDIVLAIVNLVQWLIAPMVTFVSQEEPALPILFAAALRPRVPLKRFILGMYATLLQLHAKAMPIVQATVSTVQPSRFWATPNVVPFLPALVK